MTGLETAHATHAAHATHVGHAGSGLLFRDLGDSGFSGQQQAGNGCSVLQSGASDLGGIQNALLNQIAVLAGGSVVAEVAFALFHAVHDHAGLVTSVGNDGAQRSFNSTQDQLDASVLVDINALQAFDSLLGADQSNATAGNNTFFHSSTRGVQSVFHTSLLFLHFHFGGSTDADNGNTAGQLGDALLQLLTVVIGSGFFDLNADLLDACFDALGIASAVDDGSGFLGNFNALGLAQLIQGHAFQGHAGLFGDHGAASQDGDVFQHGLAAVAEARSLDSGGLQDATDVVHNQGSQCFAFNVFGNDQQRTVGLGDLFQNRQKITDVADLLVVDQDERIFQYGNLLVGVVDEVGRQIAEIELHAFHDVEFVFERLAVFNGDHAFLANLVHGVSNDLADGLVAVGGDGTDLSDFL